MSKDVIKVLREAKKLIEKGWCQGDNATNAYGKSVHFLDKRAKRFCIAGAFGRAAHDHNLASVLPRANNAIDEVTGDVFTYNDKAGRSQAEVLKAFDDTIKRLSQ